MLVDLLRADHTRQRHNTAARAENLAPVMLRSGDSQFQVLKGKLSKKAHASGVKASVTKSWSERFFIFDYSNGDLFYWKEQPTAEFCKSNSDAEHYKGTRCVLARAKLLAASAGAPALLHACTWCCRGFANP